MTPADAIAACAETARVHDPDRYICSLFAPDAARGRLHALHAFNVEIARSAEAASEPALGAIRLQWWREAIENVFDDAPPDHPVTVALSATFRDGHMSQRRMARLIDAHQADFVARPFRNMDALASYVDQTAVGLVVLELEALGVRDVADVEAVRGIGMACGLTGIIRSIGYQARRRRLVIPDTICRDCGLDAKTVFAGQVTPAVCTAVQVLAKSAWANLESVEGTARDTPRTVHLVASLARAYLRRVARVGNNPFDPHVAMGPLARWLRVTWSAVSGRY